MLVRKSNKQLDTYRGLGSAKASGLSKKTVPRRQELFFKRVGYSDRSKASGAFSATKD